MTTAKSIAAAAVAALLVVAVIVGLYLGYWWLKRDTTDRTGVIRRDTFEFQQGRVDSAENQLTEIRRIDTQLNTDISPDTAAGLRNQRAAIVNQACRSVGEVNGPIPDDLASFKAMECATR